MPSWLLLLCFEIRTRALSSDAFPVCCIYVTIYCPISFSIDSMNLLNTQGSCYTSLVSDLLTILHMERIP